MCARGVHRSRKRTGKAMLICMVGLFIAGSFCRSVSAEAGKQCKTIVSYSVGSCQYVEQDGAIDRLLRDVPVRPISHLSLSLSCSAGSINCLGRILPCALC